MTSVDVDELAELRERLAAVEGRTQPAQWLPPSRPEPNPDSWEGKHLAAQRERSKAYQEMMWREQREAQERLETEASEVRAEIAILTGEIDGLRAEARPIQAQRNEVCEPFEALLRPLREAIDERAERVRELRKRLTSLGVA